MAFAVSVSMNTFFAPVFMTLHKVTDTHILATGGTLAGFSARYGWGNPCGTELACAVGIRVQKDDPPVLVSGAYGDFPPAGEHACAVRGMLGVVLGVLLAIGARKGEKR